jgi:molybdopterin molybdotransferase
LIPLAFSPAVLTLFRQPLGNRRGFSQMTAGQRLTGQLIPLDEALAALLAGLEPVAPIDLPIAETLGAVSAEVLLSGPVPVSDLAVSDGWAFCAQDLVGASSYSPLPLAGPPVWVEAGDRMPSGSDCVVDSDLVELSGSMFQVLGEALPGQGVRRAGADIGEGDLTIAAGRRLCALDLMLARAAGLKKLAVRRPRLHLINIPAMAGRTVTAQLIAESARAAGADVIYSQAGGRDASSVAEALTGERCDLVITVGGTGVGRTDATVEALTMRGTLIAHGIAVQPGRTTAIGMVDNIPVIAVPGAPDQALAAWWTLALPVLDRLSGYGRHAKMLPLARKISSSVGIADIVLLRKIDGAWMPLAIGDLSLDHIVRADAWLAVPGDSEGFPAGTSVDACRLRG